MTQPDRKTARRLAAESLAAGDATGWFETLYQNSQGDAAQVPWADMCVNPHLDAWLRGRPTAVRPGATALVVGCGLGDDAETLSALGLTVTAFDISETAVEWCRRRFANSKVSYEAADLLAPPVAWRAAFDLVIEIYTLQVLPAEPRAHALANLASLLAPGGTLLIVARGREPADPPGEMPWPLTRAELERVANLGPAIDRFEDFFDNEDPPVRRFRLECRRAN